jgi:hypothetical protein
MRAGATDALIASWKSVLNSYLSPGSLFSIAKEQMQAKKITFRVRILTPEETHPLRQWEAGLCKLLSEYGFEVSNERGVHLTSASGFDDIDVVIVLPLSGDLQVFCVEFAKVRSSASKMLICVPEADHGSLYCRSAREAYGVATVALPVHKLAQGKECRFGIDVVRHCADDLMKKVAATIRKLRIESTVVILIHGIRTRAMWQSDIKAALENSGLVALPTNYNKFDIVRFLLPFNKLRLAPLQKVEAEIRSAQRKFQDGQISVLAHSFGTYLTGNLLSSSEFSFDRIVFCGSVLRSDFDFDSARGRFKGIVNEIGCRDIWPALAARISRSYGPTGSFGFNRGNFVEDRKHAKYGHNHFLNREFCERFWIPYFCDGRRNDPGDVGAMPASFVRFVDGMWFTILMWGSAALLCAYPLWWLGHLALQAKRSLFP